MRNKDINLAAEIKRREDYNSMCPFPYYSTEIIEDLKKKNKMVTKKQDYNNVPIHYCKTCLSIALKTVTFVTTSTSPQFNGEKEVTFCIPCGNTDIDSAHVEEWEEMYEKLHGKKFLELDKDE